MTLGENGQKETPKVLWLTGVKLLFPQPVWIVGILEHTAHLILMCFVWRSRDRGVSGPGNLVCMLSVSRLVARVYSQRCGFGKAFH